MAVERLFFSRNVQTAFGVGQARGVVLLAAAQHGVPVLEATPSEVKSAIAGYGAADKAAGPADGPARPRAWPSGRDPTTPPTPWRSRSGAPTRPDRGRGGSGPRAAPAVLDRAAVAPIDHAAQRLRAGRARGARPREGRRARREARGQTHRVLSERPVIASVEGVVGAITADSLVIEVGGHRLSRVRGAGDPRHGRAGRSLKLHTYHLVREDQQALYGFRTAEELGFFNLLLTVNGVGPKVALAIVGSRPTADLQLAIMTGTRPCSWPSRASARSSPSGSSSSSRRRSRRPGRRRSPRGPSAARRGGERGRRRAPGARLLAGRGPRGVADRARRRVDRRDPRGSGQGGPAEPPPRLARGDGPPGRRRGGRAGRSTAGPRGRRARRASPRRGSRASRRGRRS